MRAAVLKADVTDTIQNWAKTRMNAMPSPLYIIMVDHGGMDGTDPDVNNRGRFYLGSDYITPSDLNVWLNNLETPGTGLTSDALKEQRIIIGSCYSGSFINKISKSGRVIITSANADEESIRGQKIPTTSSWTTTVQGGYDSSFGSRIGYTTLQGKATLSVTGTKLTVDRLIIK